MEWADEAVTELRTLWAEGLSTAEIGRRMGIGKNAVVGKVHRLELTPRPSPIRRSEITVTQRAAPVEHQAVSAARQLTISSEHQTTIVAIETTPLECVAIPKHPTPSAEPQPLIQFRRTKGEQCSWPIGEPGSSSFHFCDGLSVSGKPYCPDHARLAYINIRNRREDATL